VALMKVVTMMVVPTSVVVTVVAATVLSHTQRAARSHQGCDSHMRQRAHQCTRARNTRRYCRPLGRCDRQGMCTYHPTRPRLQHSAQQGLD
jgi:hypothetical protein